MDSVLEIDCKPETGDAPELGMPKPRGCPPLVGVRGTLWASCVAHALILALPFTWYLHRPAEAPRPLVVMLWAQPTPTPLPRRVVVATPRPLAPPQVAPAPAVHQPAPVEAPPTRPLPPPTPPAVQPAPRPLPQPQAPPPPAELSPRPAPERSGGRGNTPPRPLPVQASVSAPPPPKIPEPDAQDPYAYVDKLYTRLSPGPNPSRAGAGSGSGAGFGSGSGSGASDLSDLFNRGGGTPGAARILPLNSQDGYSFRARQEAFASLGLNLRQFYSDHTLYNSGAGPAQGVRRERGIERFKRRVPAGEVIQIGLLGDSDDALAEVDRRMTALEEDYLRQLGLLGRVIVHQVEYKVVLGERGHELVVGNILYTRKAGGS